MRRLSDDAEAPGKHLDTTPRRGAVAKAATFE